MWKQWLHEHAGETAGLAVGVILGFIFLFAGFWKMLVFGFIVFIAFLLGKYYSLVDSLAAELVKRLLQRFRS